MGSQQDLLELAGHLKQERLFLASERSQIQNLHEDLLKTAENVYHETWVTRQQKLLLDQLILANPDMTPETCCQYTSLLDKTLFVDGYKYLSYHESKFGEVLKQLRESPRLVAILLANAEKQDMELMRSMARTFVSSIYGNTVMEDDENYVLQVLKALIELQVAAHDNPRRLLRRGTCAFSTVFKFLNEGMYSSKLFLTASLHKPVMQLLMEDEWFYDIDPERALHRFPPGERERRFGKPNSEEFLKKTKEYRERTNRVLTMLTERFIVSIQSNMHCFPQSLAWVTSQLYQSVTKAQYVNATEARAMCADLVFASFICPAICDPEAFGVTSDAPVSYIARHNLMQVAQILQVLAISTPDEIDPKSSDLYGKFEKGCVSSLLDQLLESNAADKFAANHQISFKRAALLITMPDLLKLVEFLRDLHHYLPDECAEKKVLERMVTLLPRESVIQALRASPSGTPQPTPPGTPGSAKKQPKNREKKRGLNLLMPDLIGGDDQEEAEMKPAPVPQDVLVISIGVINECPGMLSEQKVLEQEGKLKKWKQNSLIPGEDDPVSEAGVHEKRTRFSLSHDQDSIATSDNLEAISEAASSHSVGSDLEENENDNLSDMLSANVSGRGTPNISGRDTPTSQAESQAESVDERRAPDLPITVQKTNREDVTDKFGKFEIKTELERDETKSTVSDTWSTDVLASDSEPPEQNQLERLEEVVEEMARQHLLGVQEVSEVCETASDAWSTDVLASDTSERQSDRLLELDQDEIASVSSRSQGHEDSEMSENPDHSEDTPQASDCHSPNSSSRLEDLGAACPIDDEIPEPPSPREDYFPDIPYSQASNPLHQGPHRFAEFSNYNDIMGRNYDSESARPDPVYPKAVHRINYDKDRLDEFDPFAPMHNSSPGNGNSPVSGNRAPMVQNFVNAPPSAGFVSPVVSHGTTQSDKPDVVFRNVPSKTSTPNNVSASQDTEPAANDNSGLKLTEQQNVNIDANRLSNALSLFDPLMQENFDSNVLSRRLSEPTASARANAFSRMSYNEQGARPKQYNDDCSVPKISLRVNSLSIDLESNGQVVSRPALHHFTSNKRSESDLLEGNLTEGNLSHHKHEKHDSDGSNLSVQSSSSHVSHSSQESVNSLIEMSTQSIAAASHEEHNYQKHQDENRTSTTESQVSEDDRTPDKKGKPGFFKSFKERLSKSGKKRFPRPFEKDEPTNERGGGDGGRPASAPEGSSNGDLFSRFRSPKVVSEDNSDVATHETSDDILAKYRSKSSNNNTPVRLSGDSVDLRPEVKDRESQDEEDNVPAYDPNNLENCKAFLDAKRKLRLVLSNADLQSFPGVIALNHMVGYRKENELVAFLKLQLAEAINMQDKDLIARLHETIRCLKQFDVDGIKKLLKVLKEDYKGRSPYVSYLVRCRQGVLASLSHMHRLETRISRDKSVCQKYFMSVFVRLFLEQKEKHLHRFIEEFQRLHVSDEKADLVETFLEELYKALQLEPSCQAITELQLQDARLFIERNVMSHIYTHAMYPNGDGDIMRDQILQQHMQRLSQVINPNHKDLRIAKSYHYECPWPAAQSEIFMINAYKTPKDKLQCVLRCSSTIMNLLSMVNEKSVPAADDFMPVLIFVLIKANPPGLLSTVQYVNSFYGKRLAGEENYWWIQFSSAIEFIKNMDYEE